MLKNEREKHILRIIDERGGFATVRVLCESLYASESSIRRDLCALDARGLIRRSHGGAEICVNPSGSIGFDQRGKRNIEQKRAMAQIAKRLVKNGDILFLDQSSSAFYLAEALADNPSLTVVTNNLEILALLGNSRMKVYGTGGLLCPENRTCFVGVDAAAAFSRVHADLLFFSAASLSEDGVISDLSREEVQMREVMMQNAARSVLLCDRSKHGTRSAYRQCTLRDVDLYIDELGAYAADGSPLTL